MKSSEGMTLNKILWCAVLAALVMLYAGCATPLVWQDNQFARFHEPADPANLKLYYSTQIRQVLVEYDDIRDSDGATKRRAFWLESNADRLNERRQPHFVPLKKDKGLAAIPFRPESAGILAVASSDDLAAVVSAKGTSFTLYCGNKVVGDYNLPAYRDASGRIKQVLLTPPAVVADVTIVGGVAAAALAYIWAGGCAETGAVWSH
jgi:hypothetical protein